MSPGILINFMTSNKHSSCRKDYQNDVSITWNENIELIFSIT